MSKASSKPNKLRVEASDDRIENSFNANASLTIAIQK
jgi:hypothetical protein